MSSEREPTSARQLDALYQKTDKVYYELARGCGLSETAYWILYAVEVSGGAISQARIADEFSYSRQTVNSALKTLEARGLVELTSLVGDRRSKAVSLTPEGRRRTARSAPSRPRSARSSCDSRASTRRRSTASSPLSRKGRWVSERREA